MNWLNDFLLFLFVPGLVIFAAIISYQGPVRQYKIVRETNTLDEKKYEVWFEYQRWCSKNTWQLEETFETEQEANEYVARQCKIREVVSEGKFNEICNTK